jgi:ABC-type nitrate/sulfonate/bicarbonate transport system ATPase subunit
MKIDVESLSFGYEKSRKVLDGISFTVRDGEVLGVLGSSGCGKSTLLRIICGIIPNPSNPLIQGGVSFETGVDLDSLRSKGGIGLMFQEPSLLPNLTVEQNVTFPLDIIGNHDSRGLVDELIEAVGLQRFRNYLPKHLSGGMQTRTALARTFVTKPDLLLLDEPFSALDYGWKMDLYEKLTQMIKASGSTVILVSHDIREVLLLADKVLLLSKRGTIAKELDVKPDKPRSYKPDLLAVFFDEVKPEIVLLQNYLLEPNNFLQ